MIEHGDKDVAALEQRHVKAIIEAKRATPGSARNLLHVRNGMVSVQQQKTGTSLAILSTRR